MKFAKWLVYDFSRGVFRRIVKWPVIWLMPYRQNILVRNTPNALSVLRLIAGSWAAWELYNVAATVGPRFAWIAVVMAIMATDGIDGELARQLKIESTFGAMIDPLADKLFFGQLAFYLGLVLASGAFWLLIIPLLAVELGNMAAGFFGAYRAHQLNAPEEVGSSMWGKLKFGSEIALVFFGWSLLSWTGVTLFVSLVLACVALPLACLSLAGYCAKIRAANSLLASRAHLVVS